MEATNQEVETKHMAKYCKNLRQTTATRSTSLINISALILTILLISPQAQCLQQIPTNSPSQQEQQQQQQQLAAKSYHHNGFQLFSTPPELTYSNNVEEQPSANAINGGGSPPGVAAAAAAAGGGGGGGGGPAVNQSVETLTCPNGLLTFELSTGFIFKPMGAHETLSMMPSTLQLTDCLDYCLNNQSCLAINFEMGLCVLLATSAKQNPHNLYSSQFPVFTIYAEKKCLLASLGNGQRGRVEMFMFA